MNTLAKRTFLLFNFLVLLFFSQANQIFAAKEEVTGIAKLGFSLPGLITQIINFAILLVVLRIFLWKPFLKIIDDRNQKIKLGLEAAEQASLQANESQSESKKILDDARNEASQFITDTREMAEKLKIELEDKAKQDADVILQKAKKEIERDKEQALAVIRKNFAEITISAAEKVIDKSLDKSIHEELINNVLEDYKFDNE
ncbi:MAG: F0F1 ATP synthase subunit B [Dehalococcoidia bacterium]|nr:F0F1 ATP synthase subunit B [Dehalococcoidia bacterium]